MAATANPSTHVAPPPLTAQHVVAPATLPLLTPSPLTTQSGAAAAPVSYAAPSPLST